MQRKNKGITSKYNKKEQKITLQTCINQHFVLYLQT